MAHAKLLTLTSAGRSYPFAFDGTARSQLWVGDSLSGEPTHALASLEADNGDLVLSPARGCLLSTASGETIEKATLPPEGEAVFSIASPRLAVPAILYACDATEGARTYRKLGFAYDAELLIGRDESAAFSYRSRFVSSQHARLSLTGDTLSICDLGSGNGTFVNGCALTPHEPRVLAPGDVVQVLDLVLMAGRRLVALNTPDALVIGEIPGAAWIDHEAFKAACPSSSATSGELELFYPAPRLVHSVHRRAFQVDDPPMQKKPDDQPALMQLGPSFIMGLASIFMVSSSVSRLLGGADPLTTVPMIAMSGSMIIGMVVWPIISKRYTKRRDAREELRREARYSDYLNRMEVKFGEECTAQAEVLRDNRVEVSDAEQRALELSPRLMNRTPRHDDFMDLRVGVGDAALAADIRWPQRRFDLNDDKLLDKVSALADNPPRVLDVPLAFNPADQFVAGIVGARPAVWDFARGLIVQICGLYGYQDVKLVLVADRAEEREWGFMRSLPHVFDDEGARRLIATDADALMELSMGLERELEGRQEVRAQDASDFGCYYVVLCTNKALAERSETISRISRLRDNRGFSLVFFGEGLRDLPRECGYVIDLESRGMAELGHATGDLSRNDRDESRRARMFARGDVSGTMRAFDPDIAVGADEARRFALAISRVHLDLPSLRSSLPTSLGFLEMFGAGTTAQLNIGQRWAEHDASRTLQTPLGLDAQGEAAVLNLHENVHGPHGLIAGTTGSGKSEFIITYILSLCVNYPPDQVSFVLIDYKGGGLAGAFDNDRYRLPHLAGTITNLDGAAITRSLVSVKSELKRRQDLLNRARDITGEATVDIYKYLSYYRQGVLDEPLPHLFIVADEFAELKDQEPEFMDELISAARIGRSLGVHLILATQKPTGVVNDQIWSNSRFKVCLKVADAADSKEMIKRPDAAEIKGPGRYYLLVGYNEYFATGQAAYAGVPYAPVDVFEPKRDTAVELIDDGGDAVASLRPPSRAKKTGTSELNAVLDQIEQTSRQLDKRAKALWLDPLPAHIDLDALCARYGFTPEAGSFCAVVGEADDPSSQRQFLYSIDLAEVGNVLIYGSAGSGVESLVATMLCSLAQANGADTFNLYIADLGAGSLAPFADLPQCGGVVLPGDDERMNNLFKLLEAAVAERRRLFSSTGGIDAYNGQAAADERVPRLVVVVAGMASFNELYADYEERFAALTRDAPQYGIHFIVTASASTVVRMRVKANFSASFVTSFNDPNDYVTVLGSMRGIAAPKQDKRGLMKIGKQVFEFQGASIADDSSHEARAIRDLGIRLGKRSAKRAPLIPELPFRVTLRELGEAPADAPLAVPVGFSKETVAPLWFDCRKSPSMLVLGNDIDAIGRYLRGMREVLAQEGSRSFLFIDPDQVLGSAFDENEHVVQDRDAVEAAIQALAAGEAVPQVLVLTSVAQQVAGLSADTSKALQDYISSEAYVGRTALVAASEMWRLKSLYQDWYKVLSAYGNGVWVGSGFSDQTIFRFTRTLPEYRVPAARSEGFCALRGTVGAVRFVEAEAEPSE